VGSSGAVDDFLANGTTLILCVIVNSSSSSVATKSLVRSYLICSLKKLGIKEF
jgi:hypothetical protein